MERRGSRKRFAEGFGLQRIGYGVRKRFILYFYNNLAEIYHPHREYHARCSAEFRVGLRTNPALSLVVWTLKREVRAFGECLGMQRR